MLHRITTWQTEEGEPLQVEMALLDSSWELHRSVVLPCGPFHGLEEQLAQARHILAQWIRDYGLAQELGLDF